MRAQFKIAVLLSTMSFTAYAQNGHEIIKANEFKEEVKPLLTTEWCQEGAENSLLPEVNGTKVLTGCGVTALAQVMRYWSAPTYGNGENYYIWDYPRTGREVLYADFSSTHYDWDNMINRYKDNDSATETEINAVATLMRDLGVALQVKYEDGSTATNIEYISSVLKRFYGYNPTMTIHRFLDNVYSMDEWLTMIYGELSEGRPVIMGGLGNGANHIYVADGYDSAGKVHLNLGHANPKGSINTDDYYDLTRTDQTYTSNMRMLIGIAPYPLEAPTPEFTVDIPGTLQDVLGGEIQSRRHCRIKLHGHLNRADFNCMRKLSAITTGQLSYIDMSDATVEDNTIPEDAFLDAYTLQEVILPSSTTTLSPGVFRNANGLWRLTIPEGLERIDHYAFSACRYLESLTLPASLTEIGYNPMRYVHLSKFDISEGNNNFVISNNALCDRNKTYLYAMPLEWSQEYTVEEGIQIIGPHAFSMQCMIPTVHLPVSINRLCKWAFYECLSLKHLYVASVTPPRLDDDCFSKETLAECTVHIPAGYKEAYIESDWSAFTNIVEDEDLATPYISNKIDRHLIGIFNINGQQITNPIRGGVYVLKFSDNTTSKIIY